MPLVVTTVSGPAAEPVTLDEAKAHLRVDFADDDALIGRLITAARRYCEVVAKATFVDTTFDLVDDAFPTSGGYYTRQARQFYGQFAGGLGTTFPGVFAASAGAVTFPRAPLRSVTSVSYLDPNGNAAVMSPSLYTVVTGSPGRVAPVFGQVWPVTLPQAGAVTVRFVAGFGPDATTVPANVSAAVLLVVGHLYANREAVAAGGAAAAIPMGVEHLLGVESGAGGYG